MSRPAPSPDARSRSLPPPAVTSGPRGWEGSPGSRASWGPWASLLTVIAVVLLIALGLARRLMVVSEFHNFAGDGWQYYHLAQNLVTQHRYAFGPSPFPLANSRLPGYPIFVALVGSLAPNFNDADVASRVTHSQAFLDMATAFMAFLLAGELRLRVPRLLALGLCAASPFLAIASSYVLSETLSILLTTTTLWLLLRAVRTRLTLHMGLAGATVGLGLLVRADAVTLIPVFVVPLLFAPTNWKGRARAATVAALACVLVFSPWPARNLARFHAPHLMGSSWVNRAGDPIPAGVLAWILTWTADAQQSVDVAWKMTRGTPVYTLPPEAADSPAERKRAGDLFARYSTAGMISQDVDAGFLELARERRARSPFRYYVTLPLERSLWLWVHPVPEWEMPIASPTLSLPAQRDQLAPLTHRTLLLAALGLLLCAFVPRRTEPLFRPLVAITVIAVLSRTIALVFIVPGGTQRYTFELLPLLFVLAAIALTAPAELLLRRLYPVTSPDSVGTIQ